MHVNPPELTGTHVLVVDSHPFIGWALTQHLSAQTSASASAVTDAADAIERIRDVDAVILDGTLPGVADGQLLTRLRELRPHLSIVVVNGGREPARELATGWGATRYLPPDASTDDLVEALGATLAKARASAARVRDVRANTKATPSVITLSPREQQVLELLRDGHSLPSVAATLQISLSTTKTHVARLYDKLESKSRTQALLTALRLGLLRPGPPSRSAG